MRRRRREVIIPKGATYTRLRDDKRYRRGRHDALVSVAIVLLFVGFGLLAAWLLVAIPHWRLG